MTPLTHCQRITHLQQKTNQSSHSHLTRAYHAHNSTMHKPNPPPPLNSTHTMVTLLAIVQSVGTQMSQPVCYPDVFKSQPQSISIHLFHNDHNPWSQCNRRSHYSILLLTHTNHHSNECITNSFIFALVGVSAIQNVLFH